MMRRIQNGKIESWDAVHEFYMKQSKLYARDKFQHAFASLLEVLNITAAQFTQKLLSQTLKQALLIKKEMTKNIADTRAKDYSNPFRQMLYDTDKEMEQVLGALKDNQFIKEQQTATDMFEAAVSAVMGWVK